LIPAADHFNGADNNPSKFQLGNSGMLAQELLLALSAADTADTHQAQARTFDE